MKWDRQWVEQQTPWHGIIDDTSDSVAYFIKPSESSWVSARKFDKDKNSAYIKPTLDKIEQS